MTDREDLWREYARATYALFDGLDGQLRADAGLPHSHFEIMVRLSEAPHRALRMSELANTTRWSRSRVSHAVARLERSRWVRRDRDPDDRRGQVARLTDAGAEVLRQATPGHVEAVRSRFVDLLTAEQAQTLIAVSERLLALYEESGIGRHVVRDAS